MGGAVAPPHHVMGKAAVQPAPPQPQKAVQGEPAPLMGDVVLYDPPKK
jgi:hypothetical protein